MNDCFHGLGFLFHNDQDDRATLTKHKTSKGYKTISKDLGVPVCNVLKKFDKHATVKNLPGHGGKRKIDEGSLQRLVRTVKKTSHKTSKELKADLKQSGIMDSTRTICCTLNQEGQGGHC